MRHISHRQRYSLRNEKFPWKFRGLRRNYRSHCLWANHLDRSLCKREKEGFGAYTEWKYLISGVFARGLLHAKGVFIHESSLLFDDFQHGLLTGAGYRVDFSPPSLYIGEFVGGRSHGQGTAYTQPTYLGNWTHGKEAGGTCLRVLSSQPISC